MSPRRGRALTLLCGVFVGALIVKAWPSHAPSHGAPNDARALGELASAVHELAGRLGALERTQRMSAQTTHPCLAAERDGRERQHTAGEPAQVLTQGAHPAEAGEEATAALEEGRDLIDGVIAQGRWAESDRERLIPLLPQLDNEAASQLLSDLAAAINRGEVHMDTHRLL